MGTFETRSLMPLPFLQHGVAQPGFVVHDLDQTVENYYRLFGIGPWHFYTYEKPFVPRMTRHGAPADYSMRIALSYAGEMRIELIEQKHGDTVYQEFVKRHGYGLQLIERPKGRRKPEKLYPPEV